jgi:hypothetical protein
MSTGKDNQLARQIGESIVVAELGRRGCIATSFAGNVPHFDILAVNPKDRQLQIQVKAIRGGSWQFDIRSFLDVHLDGDKQIVKGPILLPHKNLLCVFVVVKEADPDEFYIFSWRHLQKYFQKTYTDRKRPKNPSSFHCAIWPKDLFQFKDNWKILLK